jgi:hypothetical protein
MQNEFVIFHKFADYENLRDFSDLLSSMGIENRMQDNNHSYVSIVGYNEIDIPYGINIRQKDFPQADLLLETFYQDQVPGIDRDYYLFSETDEELLQIIRQPYDFGKLDLVLARHILNERGISVSEKDIKDSKEAQVASEMKIIPVSRLKLFFGYFLALVFPIAGVIIGISIYYNRTLLPNGERFYLHKPSDRRQAKIIILICILYLPVFVLLETFKRSW